MCPCFFAPLQTAESQPKHINIPNATQLADCALQCPASWPPHSQQDRHSVYTPPPYMYLIEVPFQITQIVQNSNL